MTKFIMTPSSKNGINTIAITALAITGAIRRISREKLYQEPGLESLRKRQWYRKLRYFFKTFKGQHLEYLFRILPSISKAYNTGTNEKIPLFSGKHNFFINSFFPSTVIEWNNLDLKIRNSKIFSAFKKILLYKIILKFYFQLSQS